ncbi:hypothetical protein V2J09_005104 [Rumex salicifolius]
MAKASFWTQADALLRKNLTYQKRNKRSNAFLIAFPVLLCVLLAVMQRVVDNALDKAEFKCGCNPLNNTECGLQYSDSDQSSFCEISHPPKWPALLQIPDPPYRATADGSCRNAGSCPVTILTTGNNHSLAQSLGLNLLTTSPLNQSDLLASLSNNVFGSASMPPSSVFIDSAFSSGGPLYYVQPDQCTSNSTTSFSYSAFNSTFDLELRCAQGRLLWRNTSSDIDQELYNGYQKGNSDGKINEFVTAYDFLNSNDSNFNISIWYNATYSNDTGYNQYNVIAMTRVPRSVNLVHISLSTVSTFSVIQFHHLIYVCDLGTPAFHFQFASNAYLQFLKGLGTKILLEFVKEMPKQKSFLNIDIASQIGAQLFTYVIIALFPVVLTFLVYENQNRLRIMMKMHGLGDGPYWLISYSYFLALSAAYMLFFVIFGSLIGLKIFTTNDFSIQFVFYFLFMNLQISLAFLLAPLFTDVLTARVVGNIVIFGSGLLGAFLFAPFVEDTSFPRGWIIVLELYPGFSLYRGLYELGEYAFVGYRVGTSGMKWQNLGDASNGMKEVLIIMFVEWLLVLPVAYYVDRGISSGIMGLRRFAACCFLRNKSFLQRPSLRRSRTKDDKLEMDKPDVIQERDKVEQLVKEGSLDDHVICKDLRKVYPGRDGNPSKAAVKGLSLALSQGLSEPSSGGAFVDGKSILTQMDEIYTSMGVCPQHDLLWEILTGREHLLFYGRLKNLKGEALKQAVEESLNSVNLFHGGVGDKFAGKYSGGMKRRLSVAISLIGDPKVCSRSIDLLVSMHNIYYYHRSN